MRSRYCNSLCFAAALAAAGLTAGAVTSGPVQNRAPLQANAFNPLPLGSVRPGGWLKRQEELQASGLTGHLDEFWPGVSSQSGWLGGKGESWERGPYYLDGLLPLAYQLHDSKLIAKTQKWIEWSLNSQRADGQFGPESNDDWWPRMVMLKVLLQYAEATGDDRVLPFMTRYFHYELAQLPQRPLRDWGKYRWQDNVYSVLWLYNRTGDPNLLALAWLLHQQGFDWEAMFRQFTYQQKQTKESVGLASHPKEIPDVAMQTHGVNNAMALKAAPLWWLISGQNGDRAELTHQRAMLDQYHGLPNGMFSADEHLAGLDPSQGTELCTVVETMFSLEEAFAVLGDVHLADQLERVAYNALPGTISDDMWSHQYDQQPNQIACSRALRQWSTNGPDSNLFGLEPNFGCCTANLHQGWPKFVTSLWMATPDAGLVSVAYAPSTVQTTLAGRPVSVVEETEYPFRGGIRMTIHVESAASFPISLRIPGWSTGSSMKVNGKRVDQGEESAALPGFTRISREWRDGDVLTVDFAMAARVSHWFHNAAVFERGPLVFSLPLKGQWKEIKHYTDRSGDWEIEPSRPWNYALSVGPCEAAVEEQPLGDVPFDVAQAAVLLQVRGRQSPEWKENEHSAGVLPWSPVLSTEPMQELTLVPYGAAKVRMTAFPFLSEPSTCGSGGRTPGTSH